MAIQYRPFGPELESASVLYLLCWIMCIREYYQAGANEQGAAGWVYVDLCRAEFVIFKK